MARIPQMRKLFRTNFLVIESTKRNREALINNDGGHLEF
jgi:hypothetical protein